MITEAISGHIVFAILSATSIAGAAVVVLTRDVMRLTLGLGAFFLSVAGWFLYFGHGFLATAQVFVYAGGVLVLILFAIMLLGRSEEGAPRLHSSHAIDSAVVSVGVGLLIVFSLRGVVPAVLLPDSSAHSRPVTDWLLGPFLPHLLASGLLLLVAVVTVIVVLGGERE